MYSTAVLFKIVKTRPNLIFLGAFRCSAAETTISSILGWYLMDTLLVPFKVIMSAECLRTVVGASERFGMPRHMLS